MKPDANSRQLAEWDPELQEMYDQPSTAFMDNMDAADIKTPRMLLMQSKSPWVESAEHNIGQVLHSQNEFMYLDKPKADGTGDRIEFIPLFYWLSRVYLKPFEDGGGARCRSEDAIKGIGDPGGKCQKCPQKEWWEDDKGAQKPPNCMQVNNWAILVPSAPEESRLIIWSTYKTSYPVGKTFNNRLRGLRGAPFFHMYQFSSFLDNNGTTTYWNWKPIPWDDTNRLERPFIGLDDAKDILIKAKGAEEFFRAGHAGGKLGADFETGTGVDQPGQNDDGTDFPIDDEKESAASNRADTQTEKPSSEPEIVTDDSTPKDPPIEVVAEVAEGGDLADVFDNVG